MTTWGIVATIKAPVGDILRFAAYHLSHGAHHLYLFLDDANDAAFAALNDHPRVTPVLTDDAWWAERGSRPKTHQSRQTRNATHCYQSLTQEDWLIHIDVDEFLVPKTSIQEALESVPADVLSARVRPMEQLSGDDTLFKAFIPSGPPRRRLVAEIYPNFGMYLRAGFLSHLAGKIFLRTGHPKVKLRIHKAQMEDGDGPKQIELSQIELAHTHAKTWDDFLAKFQFRLERGSYRADLSPEWARSKGGMTLHEVFSHIIDEDGQAGLRAFFDEVCAANPRLIAALDAQGLLRRVDLELDTHLRRHFPSFD